MGVLIPLFKVDKAVDCEIVERLTRFTILAEIQGSKEVIYTNNTGRLRDYLVRGKRGLCTENKHGKLRYRLLGVYDGEYVTLIDTALQEMSFLRAQELGLIPWLEECVLYKRNYRINSILVDFAFKCGDGLVPVEVKSAVLRLDNGSAGYPDAPTARGRAQILKLSHYVAGGGRAFVVFIAAIPRARKFKLYCDEDKQIKHAVDTALRSGVVFKAVNFFIDPKERAVVLGDPDLPVDLSC